MTLRESIVLATVLVLGCSEPAAPPRDVATPDMGVDAAPPGPDVSQDAPGDLGADAADRMDAAQDVAVDVVEDVTPDAASDAATDAASPDVPDARADVATDAPRDTVNVVDARADAGPADVGVADVPSTGLPPPPTAAVRECSAADRMASPANVVLSVSGDSQWPSVAWTGSEFAVAWSEQQEGAPEIYFARFTDPTVPRMALPTVTRVTTEPMGSMAVNEQPSIAWDGARYWIAWRRLGAGPETIRMTSVTPSGATGATLGTAVVVATAPAMGTASSPSLVALPASEGGGLALAWEDDRVFENLEVYFARFTSAGVRMAADVRVTMSERYSSTPRLVHGPANELALVWVDDRDATGDDRGEVYFTRLTPSGARVTGATDVRVTRDVSRSGLPSIAYDGTGYGVAWESDVGPMGRPAVFFATLDASGARRAPDLRLSSNGPADASRRPAVGWGMSEYVVVWQDDRPTHTGGDLVIQRVNAAGARVGAETFLYDDTDASERPALVWAGTQFLVAWEDEQHSHRDIWYRRLRTTECR